MEFRPATAAPLCYLQLFRIILSPVAAISNPVLADWHGPPELAKVTQFPASVSAVVAGRQKWYDDGGGALWSRTEKSQKK